MFAHHHNGHRFGVVLADDNKKMRDAVAKHLGPEFEIVRAVADGRALVDAVLELDPELAIIDISMPIMNGIDAAIEIGINGSETKMIFLTVNEDLDFVDAAFDAGGSGYVIKRCMAIDLPKALDAVIRGRKFLSPALRIDEEN